MGTKKKEIAETYARARWMLVLFAPFILMDIVHWAFWGTWPYPDIFGVEPDVFGPSYHGVFRSVVEFIKGAVFLVGILASVRHIRRAKGELWRHSYGFGGLLIFLPFFLGTFHVPVPAAVLDITLVAGLALLVQGFLNLKALKSGQN